MDCEFPAERRRWNGKLVSIHVSGVTGGHSGVEIQKQERMRMLFLEEFFMN